MDLILLSVIQSSSEETLLSELYAFFCLESLVKQAEGRLMIVVHQTKSVPAPGTKANPHKTPLPLHACFENRWQSPLAGRF